MVKAPCYRERGDFCMFWSWIFSFLSLSVQIFVDVFISKWQFTHNKLRRRHFIPWHWNWVAFCTASKTKINVFRQYEIIFIRCRSSNYNLIALKVCSRHTKASPLFFFSVRVKIHTQYAQALHFSLVIAITFICVVFSICRYLHNKFSIQCSCSFARFRFEKELLCSHNRQFTNCLFNHSNENQQKIPNDFSVRFFLLLFLFINFLVLYSRSRPSIAPKHRTMYGNVSAVRNTVYNWQVLSGLTHTEPDSKCMVRMPHTKSVRWSVSAIGQACGTIKIDRLVSGLPVPKQQIT